MPEYLPIYIMMTGVVLVVGVATLLDWLSRQDRQARNRAVWHEDLPPSRRRAAGA